MGFPQYCLLYRTLIDFYFLLFCGCDKVHKKERRYNCILNLFIFFTFNEHIYMSCRKKKRKNFEIDYMCLIISGQTHALQLESSPLVLTTGLAPVTETTSGI